MDEYIAMLSNMDLDEWKLPLELFTLAVLLGLGLWRIRKRRQEREEDQLAGREPEFDMRRDGQRLSV
jgi:hypothetical protein